MPGSRADPPSVAVHDRPSRSLERGDPFRPRATRMLVLDLGPADRVRGVAIRERWLWTRSISLQRRGRTHWEAAMSAMPVKNRAKAARPTATGKTTPRRESELFVRWRRDRDAAARKRSSWHAFHRSRGASRGAIGIPPSPSKTSTRSHSSASSKRSTATTRSGDSFHGICGSHDPRRAAPPLSQCNVGRTRPLRRAGARTRAP